MSGVRERIRIRNSREVTNDSGNLTCIFLGFYVSDFGKERRDGVRGFRELQAYIFGKAAEIDITKE
jgi:hypothetical protein